MYFKMIIYTDFISLYVIMTATSLKHTLRIGILTMMFLKFPYDALDAWKRQ